MLLCGLVAGTWGVLHPPDPTLVPVLCTPPSSGAPSHPGGIWPGALPFPGKKAKSPGAREREQFEKKALGPIPVWAGRGEVFLYGVLAQGLGIQSVH